MATTRVTIPQEWRDTEEAVDKVIPKAITLFQKTSEHKAKIDVLTFLCHGLLPKLSLSILEETLLSHIFPDLPLYVDKVFVEVEDIIHLENELDKNPSINKPELLHDLLLVLLTVLQCIESCVKHIYETFQCIGLYQVNSLPVPVLLIVKSTFSHCQKSEASYGEFFSDMAEDLSLLFRKTFELQKLLLELLCVRTEAITSNSSEKDLNIVTSACENLLDICGITELFDGNMTSGIWKSLMRLVLRNKEVLKNHLQSDRLVSQMCSSVVRKLETYDSLINDNDSKEQNDTNEPLTTKLLKVLKFLMKLLMSFVQSFHNFLLVSSFKNIVRVILSVISVSYTSLTKPFTLSSADKDSTTSLIVVVEPFLKILVLNKKFADLLTCLNHETPPKDNFSRCYILVNILVLLPLVSEEISLYWIKPDNCPEDEPRVSIYEALLKCCDSCFVEMSLPVQLQGTMWNGKAKRMISFYEYVISRMSASISAISSENFHVLENVLLKSIFGHSEISSSISTDVWCFMARWMTADVCYSHVKLFLLWLDTVQWRNDQQKNRLCTLVSRLLPLVAQEHQVLLAQEYSPESPSSMNLWSIIPVHKMVESVRIQVVPKIVQVANSIIEQWLNKTLPQSELKTTLCCLRNLLSHSETIDYLPMDVKTDLCLAMTSVFDAFVDSPKEVSEVCWSSVLGILQSLLPFLQQESFSKVLSNIAQVVNHFNDGILNVYFARLMAHCGKLPFPVGQNESMLISKIFRTLITSSHWLVHNEGFAALRSFAEVTPYTPVLEECVPDDMKDKFQKYICTIPYGSCEDIDQNTMLLNVLKEQEKNIPLNKKIESSSATIRLDKRKHVITDNESAESDKKRSKVESHISDKEEVVLSSCVEELSKNLLLLQGIHSRSSQLPPNVCEKLKEMKAVLDLLVKSN